MQSFILFVAQGFGIGRIPVAPGTFGSLIGVLWFFLLVQTGNVWCYAGGTLLGLVLSVWLCGKAEKILNQTDPSSIVLDEIAAIPLCFASWIAVNSLHGPWLYAADFLEPGHRWWVLVVFLLFRFFDIVKPWPIRQSQRLPGGWGVTADDVLAAIYVAALSAISFASKP